MNINQLPGNENLKQYIVLYRIESIMSPLDAPFGFNCWAEDMDHAEEQLTCAEPDANIVWVFYGDNYQVALDDYYGIDTEVSE